MSLIRWNPLREMDLFNRFDEFFKHFPSERESMHTFDWRPSVDVKEDPENFIITADLPGVDRDDIEIEISDGVLKLAGERQSMHEEGKEGTKMHRIERTYGRFERSFRLEPTVDTERILATYEDGILTVKLAKRPAPVISAGKKIPIS